MKKIIYLFLAALILTACSSYKALNLNRLTAGMTKAQVESVAGIPYRILAINQTDDGIQEVLEYRTSRDEVYALEFWNNYLTGYEYLYEDNYYQYIPPVGPPTYFPDYGRPIIVVPGRPDRPNYDRPGQGSNRPPAVERPPATRPPAVQRPTTRPTEGARPVGPPSGGASAIERERR